MTVISDLQSNFLKKCTSSALNLSRSKDPKDAYKIEEMIRSLHRQRSGGSPQQQSAVTETIFKIHDQALLSPLPLVRQQAQITTLCGFVWVPVKDIKIVPQILNRAALVENITNVIKPLKKIVQISLDLYERQNYKAQDENLSVACRLKSLIQMIANCPKKKNIDDKRWLNENASKLAKINPIFKKFADQFPPVEQKRTCHFCRKFKHAYDDAVCVYSKTQGLYSGSRYDYD